MLESESQMSMGDLSFIHRQEKNFMWDSVASSTYMNYPEDLAQPKCSLSVEKLKVLLSGLVAAENMRIF